MGRVRQSKKSLGLPRNTYLNKGKYLRWRHKDTRQEISLGVYNTNAILVAHELNDRYDMSRLSDKEIAFLKIENRGSGNGSKTISELLDHWENNYWKPKIKQGGVKQSYWDKQVKFSFSNTHEAFGDKKLNSLSFQDFYNFLNHPDITKSKYKRLVSFWKLMFAWGQGNNFVPKDFDPVANILTWSRKGGTTEKERSRLAKDEFIQIVDFAINNDRVNCPYKDNRYYSLKDWFVPALLTQMETATDASTLMSMRKSTLDGRLWYYTRQKTEQYDEANVAIELPNYVFQKLQRLMTIYGRDEIFIRKTEKGIFVNDSTYYSRTFSAIVRELGISKGTEPTSHEVRSLAVKIAKDNGYSEVDRQRLLAHKDVRTQDIYLKNHCDKKWFEAKALGLNFPTIFGYQL